MVGPDTVKSVEVEVQPAVGVVVEEERLGTPDLGHP
jgi:hypothetical protein